MKIIKVAKSNRKNIIKCRLIDIMVDDEDYERLLEYDWTIRNGYAATKIGGYYQSMHRMIAGVGRKEPILVDHEDNNPYNNQKYNLRRADRFQNQQNRKTNKGNTLPKGIRQLPSGMYNVRIQTYGKRQIIGTYPTLEEAVEERNRVAKHKHGAFFNASYIIPQENLNESPKN